MSKQHSPAPDLRQKRRDVWKTTACYVCNQLPGSRCVGRLRADGSRKPRFASHRERWTAYREKPDAKD